MPSYVIIMLLLLGLSIIGLIRGIYVLNRKRKQLKRYLRIEIGMPENEMLLIMGDGFVRSLLKDNRKKYEWRMNATSTAVSHNGISVRSYDGVKKVDIIVKDGYVEEVRPYNV